MSLFLLRYGEIALKGANRRVFLDALVRNVGHALEHLGRANVRASFGRVVVSIEAPADAVSQSLRAVFGVVSFSPIVAVPVDLPAITDAAVDLVGRGLQQRPQLATFKVDTRRADKRFPLTSMDTSRAVGTAIRDAFPRLRGEMRAPDLLVRIDLRERAYLSTETIPGPGGLPVGTAGRVLALISGGIDSPVAAWLAARRGAILIPVYFHSFPFTSDRAREKVIDLCTVLSAYTGPLELWVAYFTEIQRAIQLHVGDGLRVLAMRRMMMRVCDTLAARLRAQALVTGESLGQVASQTLESLAVINAVTTLPVLRPLIGADKTEITARAEAIGTYPISIRPYPDCCSLFLPTHPRTQPSVAELERAEAGLDLQALVAEALERSERLIIARHPHAVLPVGETQGIGGTAGE